MDDIDIPQHDAGLATAPTARQDRPTVIKVEEGEQAIPKTCLLSVIVPAYREAVTIEEAIKRLTSALDGIRFQYEVILVSDGNTDGTPEIVRSLNLPYVRVLHYQDNQGKGYALCHGIRSAQGDLIAFIDADLDIDPSGIERFLEILEQTGADAVVASKIHPESKVDYPPIRRFQSKVFRQLVRVFFNLEVSDTQTGLKLFRRELLDTCLPHITSVGFAFDLELLVLANDASYRVVEGPLHLKYQFSTTTTIRDITKVLMDILRLQHNRLASQRHGNWISRREDVDPHSQHLSSKPMAK